MYNIGVIGCGMVGSALVNGFKVESPDYCDVRIHDSKKSEIIIGKWKQKTESLEDVVKNSEFIFVCLPTPYVITDTEREEYVNAITGEKKEVEIEWGKIDLEIMDKGIEKIVENIISPEQVIIIKSTVIPGTTKNYSEKYPNVRFCFNPEFLREKDAYKDFLNPDMIIIGSEDNHTKLKVLSLYRNRFSEKVPLMTSNTKTAEMGKYMINAGLASVITFANEFKEVCDKEGIDYYEAINMVKADRRFSNAPLYVTSERGFGGKCLPKDMVALIGYAKQIGVDTPVLKAIWKKNLRIRTNRDWHEIPGARTEKKEKSF